MSHIKFTPELSRILMRALEIGNTKNPPFTAERFLVALIEQMQSDRKTEDKEIELRLAEILFAKKTGDLNAAKETLMEYICRENAVSFMDDLYMKKKLNEAAAVTKKSGEPKVDVCSLLLCILKDPSATVLKILIPSPDGTSGYKADPSDEKLAEDVSVHFEELHNETKNVNDGTYIHRAPKAAPKTEPEENAEKAPEDDSQKESDAPRKAFGAVLISRKESNEKAKAQMSALVSDVRRVRTVLQNSVYGQDNAINVFVTGYFQANMLSMIDRSRKRPRATFLFAGPPGVGKTFLAEKAAQALKLPFMRFDMSEYADKEANIEFCGSDKVYKNGKAGNVTSFVAENPKCVLLFDEIEKANITVIHLFLQMLDAGRLRDNFTDEEVSFSDAIIILTTNAGKQLYEESESGDFSAVSRKVIVKALQKDVDPKTRVPYFPGAICSRFASGNVVMFNHIGAHSLRDIAKKEIRRHASSLERETGISIQIDERVYTALLFSESSAADARTIRSRAETFFNDELYELLRLIASEKVKTGVKNIEKITVSIDLEHAQSEICEMFAASEKAKVMILAGEETVALCKNKAQGFEFICVQNVEEATAAMKTQDVDFALLDMRHGASAETSASLNVEDVESPARDLFRFIREQRKEIPVYLIENRSGKLDEEEKISFMRQGVRGILHVTKGNASLAKELEEIAMSLHQQASMIKLAKENKLISFETAQSVSKNGKNAEIKLFDFKMTVAVDSEDAKNILSAVSKPNVRFDDVIGATDAKKELTYFVEYLKNSKKYMGTGVKAPKGVILYGPPGTGKTMLAKAMACEAGVTFIAAEGNQFLKKYVGEGSEKVHELFKTARKYAPSILFIDEIDAIAKERKGSDASGATGEETLTAFLTEMDGFVNDPSKPVFVLAATNFDVEPGGAKSLDPALMRRFDRRVYIDLPDKADRIRFLKMKIEKNHALDISEAQIENISMRATGMSLAELDSVVELALRSAIREGSTAVTDAILEEAFETFNGGEAKKWDVSQLERVARHEAGHAFLCWLSGETPSYLTIVARGNHGGYMQHAEQEGKAIYTKDELLARIRTSLGGRAAEIAYYGERDGISTGASGDLAAATNTAQQIVCAYGMDDDFGLAVVNGAVAANGTMSVEVRASVNRILKEQMNEAVRLISENKDKIDSLVEELMSKNHLNGAEIEKAITKNQISD